MEKVVPGWAFVGVSCWGLKCEDDSEAFQDSEAEYFLEFSFDDCFIFVS